MYLTFCTGLQGSWEFRSKNRFHLVSPLGCHLDPRKHKGGQCDQNSPEAAAQTETQHCVAWMAED